MSDEYEELQKKQLFAQRVTAVSAAATALASHRAAASLEGMRREASYAAECVTIVDIAIPRQRLGVHLETPGGEFAALHSTRRQTGRRSRSSSVAAKSVTRGQGKSMRPMFWRCSTRRGGSLRCRRIQPAIFLSKTAACPSVAP